MRASRQNPRLHAQRIDTQPTLEMLNAEAETPHYEYVAGILPDLVQHRYDSFLIVVRGRLQSLTNKQQLTRRQTKKVARPTGFEPVTPAFGGQYSIQLSYGRTTDPLRKGAGIIASASSDVHLPGHDRQGHKVYFAPFFAPVIRGSS